MIVKKNKIIEDNLSKYVQEWTENDKKGKVNNISLEVKKKKKGKKPNTASVAH